MLMALGSGQSPKWTETALFVIKRVVTHPFNIASAAAVFAAAIGFEPPQVIDTMLTF